MTDSFGHLPGFCSIQKGAQNFALKQPDLGFCADVP